MTDPCRSGPDKAGASKAHKWTGGLVVPDAGPPHPAWPSARAQTGRLSSPLPGGLSTARGEASRWT